MSAALDYTAQITAGDQVQLPPAQGYAVTNVTNLKLYAGPLGAQLPIPPGAWATVPGGSAVFLTPSTAVGSAVTNPQVVVDLLTVRTPYNVVSMPGSQVVIAGTATVQVQGTISVDGSTVTVSGGSVNIVNNVPTNRQYPGSTQVINANPDFDGVPVGNRIQIGNADLNFSMSGCNLHGVNQLSELATVNIDAYDSYNDQYLNSLISFTIPPNATAGLPLTFDNGWWPAGENVPYTLYARSNVEGTSTATLVCDVQFFAG